MNTLLMSPASLLQDPSWSSFGERAQWLPTVGKRLRRKEDVVSSAESEGWQDLKGVSVAGYAPVSRLAETEKLRAAVGARIRELLKYCLEDNEPIIEPESAHSLLQFLAQTHTEKMPLIASDDQGHLIATWKKSSSAMLSLKFLKGVTIEYAIAVEGDNGKIERDWGDSNWEALFQNSSAARAFLA